MGVNSSNNNNNNNNMNPKHQITLNKLIWFYKRYVLNYHSYRETLFIVTSMALYPLFFIFFNYFFGNFKIFPAIFTQKCEYTRCKIEGFSINETHGLQYFLFSVMFHSMVLSLFLVLAFLTAAAGFLAGLIKSVVLYMYRFISKKCGLGEYIFFSLFFSYILIICLFWNSEIFRIGGIYYSLSELADLKSFGFFMGSFLYFVASWLLTILIDFVLFSFFTLVFIIYQDFFKFLAMNFEYMWNRMKNELEIIREDD